MRITYPEFLVYIYFAKLSHPLNKIHFYIWIIFCTIIYFSHLASKWNNFGNQFQLYTNTFRCLIINNLKNKKVVFAS